MVFASCFLHVFPQEEDEGEAMGDVDLFALTHDGSALTVNSKWLQHLEERLLGEDGHPRKAKPGEDPHRCASVLLVRQCRWQQSMALEDLSRHQQGCWQGHAGARNRIACSAVWVVLQACSRRLEVACGLSNLE